MRKDKQKIIGEPISDEQLKKFIDFPSSDNNTDFHRLLKAYQGLRDHDFARFITFFVAQGGNLQAKNQNGQSFINYISNHKHATPYIKAIENNN